MPRLKLALACGLAALTPAACASATKPLAGSQAAIAGQGHGLHGRIDDPRKNHLKCLREHQVPVTEPSGTSLPEIQVGRPGVGPLIQFLATPGAGQDAQISGREQGAEVIGSALLFPNQTVSSQELGVIETCTALGVKG